MSRYSVTLVVLMILLFNITVSAEEGMWPLYDLGKLPYEKMKSMGLELELNQIYNPDGPDVADACINLSGGSSSFVSEKGLIITNHHVAFGAIQKQSTVERNYIRDGFYAETLKDEIPAIGYNVNVTLLVEDKTKEVLSVVDEKMTDSERYDAIDEIKKKIIAEAEADRDVFCQLKTMIEGKKYVLYTFFRIKDIRIVYAPPNDIGSFGGDIDNWMWPRHCGDFAFVRAYVGPDGSSASYSEENVPYKPISFLPISSKGLSEGDFTMLIGYPARTDRYSTSAYIQYLNDLYYPFYLEVAKNRLAILEEEAAKDPEVAIRLDSKKSGINNYFKKTKGIVEGFKRSDVISSKKKNEKELNDFIGQNEECQSKYGTVISELDKLYIEDAKTYQKDFILDYMIYASDFLSMSNTVYKWSVEREKEDNQRQLDFQKRDALRSLKKLENKQINLIPSHDLKVLKYFVNKALTLAEDQKIDAIENIFADSNVDSLIDEMYAETRIGELEYRSAMFEMTKEELVALNDPMINFAAALRPELDEQKEREEALSGAESRLKPLLFQAYSEFKKGDLYPNANSTKRFNYGQVMGYSPADGVNLASFTTLNGILEKETGKFPFIICEKLKDVILSRNYGKYYESELDDVPVNVITSNSGTNGNSGSPIINGRGEFVGIDFDTDYEGVAADYFYDGRYVRAVAVDSRYILFLIDQVYHLDSLVNELTIH